jgi:ADP-ribose pyrophosphatase YjhB (NUDIX family)
MHHIQRKILNLLMHSPALNYAKLRPTGVESNHFAYHLEQLIKAGLVVKSGQGYNLTHEGSALADRVSHADVAVRKQPHIVTTMCITNESGQSALFEHSFQPYLGVVGFPQGRLHYDEHIQEAAVRELHEKTGLEGVELTHRGMVYIHASRQGADISKLLAHVFTGSVKGMPELTCQDPRKGTAFWSDAAEMKGKHMPGFHEIRRLLEESGSLFFEEIETEL